MLVIWKILCTRHKPTKSKKQITKKMQTSSSGSETKTSSSFHHNNTKNDDPLIAINDERFVLFPIKYKTYVTFIHS